MIRGSKAFFLRSRSNVQLLGIFAVLLVPLFFYLGQPGTVAINDNVLFILSTFVIVINGVNCLLASMAYRHKKDNRVIFLGIAAAILAGCTIAGRFSDSFQVPGQLLAFVGLAAALFFPRTREREGLWSNKTVVGAALAGLCLLAVGYVVIDSPASLDSVKLAGAAVIALTLVMLRLSGLKRHRNALKDNLRLLLIGVCCSIIAALLAGETVPAGEVAALGLVYQSIVAMGLFVGLKEVLVEQPARTFARLQRLRQSAVVRQKVLLRDAEQDYKIVKETMAIIHNAITSGGKLTGFLEQVVNDAVRMLDSDHVFLSLLEGQPQLFWVVAYKSSFQPIETSLENKFMGKKYAEGQVVCLEDIHEFLPRLRPEVARAGLKSMVGVPIMIDGKLIGVFEVFSKHHAGFSAHQTELIKFYADQTAVAVKMDRLNEESARRSDELALLHEVVRVVTDQPSPTMLLAKAGKLLTDFLRADAFAAFVVQRHSVPPLVRAVHAQDFAPADVDRLEALFARGQLAGLRQDSSGNELFAKLLQPVLVPLTLGSGKTVSVLPLFFRQTLQGVIVFLWDYDRKANRYSHTEATLATIAIQVAMGLERDYLYGSIQKIGLTDTLTGIANRRFFDYTLKRELLRVRRYGRPLSLLMVDIDFFKKINDRYGHPAGDVVLQEMGELLKGLFRATDLPARYGGEEFAVILPETPAVAALALAEKLRDQGAKKVFAPLGERISLTISIGVATLESNMQADKLTEADLILAADQALYRAKHAGRNRVEVWS